MLFFFPAGAAILRPWSGIPGRRTPIFRYAWSSATRKTHRVCEKPPPSAFPAIVCRWENFQTETAQEREICALLEREGIELVCLAGYMRLIGPELLEKFPGRIMNIHPSLLPAFPGLHAQRQALRHGVKISGCTVHFVDAGLDSGPIIAQQAVQVRADDSEDTLSQRILRQEHRLYPRAIRLYFAGRLQIRGRTVIIADK